MPGPIRPAAAEGAPKDTPGAGWAGHAQRLQAAVERYADRPAYPRLTASLAALAAADFAGGIDRADAALAIDPGCALAWRLIGLCREGQGEAIPALEAYQAAHALAQDDHDLLSDLGRLAMTLGLPKVAAEFFAKALTLDAGSAHLASQLSAALRDSHEYDTAVGVLRSAIEADTGNPLLWNALGAVILQQGDTDTALVFLEQAAALAPDWSEPVYNRAIARLELGDFQGAETDCNHVLARVRNDQKPGVTFVRAQARLAAGDLGGGWADYAARLDPDFPRSPTFACPGRRWRPADDLLGQRLLVMGEQGLGDEIMFANMLPRVLRALGGEGRLTLAVAPRLVALFARSFPGAEVHAYQLDQIGGRAQVAAPAIRDPIDLWAPIGALAEHFARDLPSLADPGGGSLTPDPDQVLRWRKRLRAGDARPKVGLTWKSRKTYGHRLKQYPAFEAFAPLLRLPGVQFVNLQYGDCGLELTQARGWGTEIWDGSGLDLTNDIDGAAALSAAVDLVIGVGNASTNLAAAVGVPAWFIAPRAASWPRLGTDRHPWFPNTRVFAAETFNDWSGVFERLEDALREIQTAASISLPKD